MGAHYTTGLVSVSFRRHGIREIANAACRAELTCIEWGSDIHAPCDDNARLKEIAALQESCGIRCCSYGTYFRLGQTPLAKLPAYIEAAHILGTNVLRLWCGDTCGDGMTDDERAALIDTCRRAAVLAEQSGVILCTECHRGTFTERPADTVALMQAVDSPAFRTYWQPFQWLSPAENAAVARQLAPYTEHVHVFQWSGTERFSLEEGADDWRSYLAALPAPRTLLLEFMPDDRIASLPREAAALHAIAGGLL